MISVHWCIHILYLYILIYIYIIYIIILYNMCFHNMWHDSNMTCIMDIMIINPIVGNPSANINSILRHATDCWGTLGNKGLLDQDER